MNYIDKIFARVDMQQIREFRLHGVEGSTDARSYVERIENAHKAFSARLHKDYPNEKDFEEIAQPIYDYVTVIENVYMEIGLQVGAILAAQTAQNLKTAFEGE